MQFLFTLLIFTILFQLTGHAQFNDSTQHYVSFNSAGNINKTNSADAYLLNNSFKFSMRKKKAVLNFNNGWLYGQQRKRLTNNDYSAALDFNLYPRDKRFYVWGLGNYATSYSLKIANQLQAGAGAAYNIIYSGNMQLNLSNGLLYETSQIRLTDSTEQVYNTFRNSLRLVLRYKLMGWTTFEGTGFLQNSLRYENDYIIRVNTSLGFKLNKWLNLNTSLTYNKLARTRRENLLLSYGLKAERYF